MEKWRCSLKRSPDAQNQLVAAVNMRGHQLCPLQELHTGLKRKGQHDSNIVHQFRALQTSSPLHVSVSSLLSLSENTFLSPYNDCASVKSHYHRGLRQCPLSETPPSPSLTNGEDVA